MSLKVESVSILILLARVVDKTSAISKTEQLYDDLLSGYYKNVRPCVDCGSPLVINITFHLTALNDLNEVAGEMSSIGYLTVTWYDSRLAWNPLVYDGIGTTFMPYEEVWTPGLLVGNPSLKITDLNGKFTRVRLMYNGLNIWSPGDVFWTKCYPDIYRYPFDEQECYITFIPWGYLANEVIIHDPENTNPTPFYTENGEWILKKVESSAYIENSMALVRFTFTYSRRAQFLVVNVILPIIFLSFLNCLVFVIPANCGERISYSITVLLSFAVFMTLVGDNVPKTSDPMSLLCFYLLSAFAMSALIAISTIFIMSIFHRDPNLPVTKRYRALVMMMQNPRIHNPRVAPDTSINPVTVTDLEKEEFKENIENYVAENSKQLHEEVNVTWIEVSKSLDKVCMISYFIIVTVTSISQLMYIYFG